jgi:RNA polymerase sigma-70 factor (ECF subfamily)
MTTQSYDDGAEEDGALVRRWLSGDERAATAIVARHADAVARFAASAGGGDDVDEVVQDTFVRAFGSLESFRGDSSLRTWLFTIARRLLLDRGRAAARRRVRAAVAEAEPAASYTALDAMVADETETRLRRALERLTPMQRDVFTLRVGEGQSYKEIAQVLGSTEGAARVHYHNAMRQIKELIDE